MCGRNISLGLTAKRAKIGLLRFTARATTIWVRAIGAEVFLAVKNAPKTAMTTTTARLLPKKRKTGQSSKVSCRRILALQHFHGPILRKGRKMVLTGHFIPMPTLRKQEVVPTHRE